MKPGDASLRDRGKRKRNREKYVARYAGERSAGCIRGIWYAPTISLLQRQRRRRWERTGKRSPVINVPHQIVRLAARAFTAAAQPDSLPLSSPYLLYKSAAAVFSLCRSPPSKFIPVFSGEDTPLPLRVYGVYGIRGG